VDPGIFLQRHRQYVQKLQSGPANGDFVIIFKLQKLLLLLLLSLHINNQNVFFITTVDTYHSRIMSSVIIILFISYSIEISVYAYSLFLLITSLYFVERYHLGGNAVQFERSSSTLRKNMTPTSS
jgi:hypothetical protein